MNRFGTLLLFVILFANIPCCFSQQIGPVGATEVTLGKNRELLVNGKPFFPIMVWMQSAANMAYQKSLGVNVFVGQGDRSCAMDFCERARQHGVYAVPGWDSAQAGSIKNNPALLGWVFDDEPDNPDHRIPPSRIRNQYLEIRKQDPSHLTFLTVTDKFSTESGSPKRENISLYRDYARCTDLIGFDLYPVYGWCRPDWIYKVGKQQRELAEGIAGPEKGTFQWIECVKTSGQWCSNPARGKEDGLYGYEVRDQVWLAIVNGANAIGYFTHSWKCPGYSQCCINEELEATMRTINRQITELTDALCAPDSKMPIGVRCADPEGRVETRVKEFKGNRYIIAVNVINCIGARDTQQVQFMVPGPGSEAKVYDENRTIDCRSGFFTDRFTREDPVHVYILPTD